VGGHWPTKSAQWSLPSNLNRAETPIEPSASQYHVSSGILSVARKNVSCASSACGRDAAIVDPSPQKKPFLTSQFRQARMEASVCMSRARSPAMSHSAPTRGTTGPSNGSDEGLSEPGAGQDQTSDRLAQGRDCREQRVDQTARGSDVRRHERSRSPNSGSGTRPQRPPGCTTLPKC
jgi:hypothetical protein